MSLKLKTNSIKFDTGIEGVSGHYYREGNKMFVSTYAYIAMSETFDVTLLEVIPYGYKVTKKVSEDFRITNLGSFQGVSLKRTLEIEGWSSEAVITTGGAEPVEVNDTEELRQLVKEEVDKAMKSMLRSLVDKMEGR